MKKFKLFLLATVAAAPLLQSCNDSKVEGADSMALVTILNPGGISAGYYFKADNGQTLYPAQFAVATGSYNPDDGQRAFIYYSLLEEKSQKYDYNIKLYGLSEILTKEVESMDPGNEEEFGDDPITLVQLDNGNGYDCLISGGYITLSFKINALAQEGHKISLVRNSTDDNTAESDYTLLELRHKSDKMSSEGSRRTSMASFKLNGYDPVITGKKGLKIRIKDFNENIEYVQIDYQK